MIKKRNEPMANITLSYADIEIILTSLEHHVPRTSHAKNKDICELMQLIKQYETRLFKAIKESK